MCTVLGPAAPARVGATVALVLLIGLLLAACTGKTSSAGNSGSSSLATSTKNAGQSPGIERIAFESDRDGNFEIYTMNVDGTGLTRLTENPARDHLAAWSPDGRKIAFASDRSGGGDIYVMEADGTGVTRLTTSPGIDANAEWSPDGAYIAFNSSRGGDSDIYVMKSDGADQQRATKGPGEDIYPPGHRESTKSCGVRTQKATSTSSSTSSRLDSFSTRWPISNFSRARANDCAPNWSPDGRNSSSERLRRQVRLQHLRARAGKGQGEACHRRSRTLIRTRHGRPRVTRSRSRAYGDGNADIYVDERGRHRVTRLTHSTAADGIPAWSP